MKEHTKADEVLIDIQYMIYGYLLTSEILNRPVTFNVHMAAMPTDIGPITIVIEIIDYGYNHHRISVHKRN